MSTQGGGPPNKWANFDIAGLTREQVNDKLNTLARLGFTSDPVLIPCTDGMALFIGGYSSEQ